MQLLHATNLLKSNYNTLLLLLNKYLSDIIMSGFYMMCVGNGNLKNTNENDFF